MADHAQLLARRDGGLTPGKCRRDHAEMAVDANEAIVLHHHLEAAGTLALNPQDASGASCADRSAGRRRHVDAIVIGSRQRPVRQDARPERR